MLEMIGIAVFITEIILHLKRDNNTSYINNWLGCAGKKDLRDPVEE